MKLVRFALGFLFLSVAAPAGAANAYAPIEPPARAAFDAALIAGGAQLAAIGNCNICHTAPGGKPYAGGRPLHTQFGTIYATNITPDPGTGIGRWSQAAFDRAMREGIDREGRHLYPAFPYDHYTKVTDDDLRAIYAFVMTREAVRAVTPPNKVPFPFNIRALLAGWKALFLERGVFQPDPSQTAEWNRGAYLVQGLGHCGACHTPRNALGAEKKHEYLSGGEVSGWHGPALNAGSVSPAPWDADRLYRYLRNEFDELQGIAAGPMAPVVHNLAEVPEKDVRALAVYVASLFTPAARQRGSKPEGPAKALPSPQPSPQPGRGSPDNGPLRVDALGAAVYAGACAACHDNRRQIPSGGALPLALSTAVAIPTPSNLIHIIFYGNLPRDGEARPWMPGFAAELSDEQVAALVRYLRAQSGAAPWDDVEGEVKKSRRRAQPP